MNTDFILEQLARDLRSETSTSTEEYGVVVSVGDGVIQVSGLPRTMAGELVRVETSSGSAAGLVLNLERELLGVVLLAKTNDVKVGDRVLGEGRVMDVPVGAELLGRVIDPLGRPLDGQAAPATTERGQVEKIASGVIARQAVNVPLQTGLTVVDAITPIGRGQRQLIIGDRGTGKTAIAIDAIINQSRLNRDLPEEQRVISIYVAIGQKQAKVARLAAQLAEMESMGETIIVSASASDPAPLNFLAPYAGVAMAEFFMARGRDVLIIYDDLSKHAWAYRELSLLLRRPPGREAYPGDIFYLHSRLLERAARVTSEFGGGSITALPIIETQAGDVSAYIPTNVISITDGQIYLESDLFNAGFRPAMNIGLSVSRVGGDAQLKAMKKVAGKLRLDLAQYRELASFAQFSSDLDAATKAQIDRGVRLMELLKQPQYQPLPVWQQVVRLSAATNGHLDAIPEDQIAAVADKIVSRVSAELPEYVTAVMVQGQVDDDLEGRLQGVIKEVVAGLSAS